MTHLFYRAATQITLMKVNLTEAQNTIKNMNSKLEKAFEERDKYMKYSNWSVLKKFELIPPIFAVQWIIPYVKDQRKLNNTSAHQTRSVNTDDRNHVYFLDCFFLWMFPWCNMPQIQA